MATYGTDLTTRTDAESGTWTEFASPYNGGGSPGSDTENFIQGVGCTSQSMSASKSGLIFSVVYDHGSNITFTTGHVVLIWQYFAVGSNINTYANGGMRAGIGSSTSAWNGYATGGNDRKPYPAGAWQNVAIDPTRSADYTIGGGNGGSYRYFGSVVDLLAAISKGTPHGVDAIRTGRAEIYCTGTGCDFDGIAAYNDANTTSNYRRLGLFENTGGGTYLWKGLLSLGQSGTSTTFTDANKTIVIEDAAKTYLDFNFIQIRHASSTITWTNISFSSLGTVSPGCLEMIENATFTLSGCTFNNMDLFTFLSNGSLTLCNFIGCAVITGGGADFVNCNFSGYEGTADTSYFLHDVTTDPDTLMNGSKFTMGTALTHAIEFDATNTPTTITLRNIDFSGYHATNGNTSSALYFPSTSKSYTVNLIGCTGDISYKVGSGGSVTLVTDPVDLTITVQDEAKVAIKNAQCSIFLLDSPFTELMNEDSLSTGIAAEQYSGTIPVDIKWRVRKSELVDVIRYLPESGTGQITANGFTQIVTLKVNEALTLDFGSEEVSNGDFSSDTVWTKNNGSTIGSGVGNLIAAGALGNTGSNASFWQDASLTIGKTYRVWYDVKRISGTGNFDRGMVLASEGTHTVTSSFVTYSFDYTVPGSGEDRVAFGGVTSSDVFEIDNVSVKEIL